MSDYIREITSASKSESIIRRLSEIDELDPIAKVCAETAYRRGFCQGYFEALEHIQDYKLTSEMAEYLYGYLYAWRYKKHDGEKEPPPTMEGPVKR